MKDFPTSDDLARGPKYLAGIEAATKMPGGDEIAELLRDMATRISALENRDGGWRKP